MTRTDDRIALGHSNILAIFVRNDDAEAQKLPVAWEWPLRKCKAGDHAGSINAPGMRRRGHRVAHPVSIRRHRPV